jgi:precorrin-2 methylase
MSNITIIEKIIKKSKSSIITISEIKQALKGQVTNTELRNVIQRLENNNKIAVTTKGITWIYSTNSNLKRMIENGIEI